MSYRFFTRIAWPATVGALLAIPAAAGNSTWQIDPAHSTAQFSVRHLGISSVHGQFHKVTGTIFIDDKDIAKSAVDVRIDASTVDTQEPDRDKHLKSADFFDIEHYPAMTFKSTKVEQLAPGKLRVTGDLSIRGVSKQIVLDVEGPSAAIKDPWGSERAAASATVKINRQDFGVKWNKTLDSGGLMIGDDVAITLEVEMVKSPQAPEPENNLR